MILAKYGACLVLMIGLCWACYMLGKAHAKVQYVCEQKEEMINESKGREYVQRKNSKIYAMPHRGRDELIRLFREGEL